MAQTRTFSRAFNGGELTPEFFGQLDDAKYASGLAQCENFIVLPHGPVHNRSGFEYVLEVKDSTKKTRLIPFSYSVTQTMVIEMGAGYFRFHTQGATLDAAPNVPYEIPNPYAETDLFDIQYVQSNDVLTLTHANYPPMELRRLGATNWTLTNITFGTTLPTPAAPAVTPTLPSGVTASENYFYLITALDSTGGNESLASPAGSASNNLNAVGASNRLTWSAVAGATYYNVYRYAGGIYAYLGQANGTQYIDDGSYTPDTALSPPNASNPFNGASNYPAAVTYFEQRRLFSGTINAPQTCWTTKSGYESNLNYSIPSRDDDGITFTLAARTSNAVRHLVPLNALIVLTSAAEFRVTSVSNGSITPSDLSVRPQSYVGAGPATPVIVNNSLLYAAARGGHMRELAYNWQSDGYLSNDVSLRAPHLFDGFTIVDMAYSGAPYPLVWAVSSNGNLIGFTYVPEQQIGAWHHHTTEGSFESVCVVTEGDVDVLYAVVNRTIDGVTKRYVERQMERNISSSPADGFFVDAGLLYEGAAATTISGLNHLNGMTVSILADGAVMPQQVVTGGQVVLDEAASKVVVGLPYASTIQTLPVVVEGVPGLGQGRSKNVNKVFVRTYLSSGVFAGPDLDSLTELKQRTFEPYGTAPGLISDEYAIVTSPEWSRGGQLYIAQSDPLPLTIVSLTLEVEIAG